MSDDAPDYYSPMSYLEHEREQARLRAEADQKSREAAGELARMAERFGQRASFVDLGDDPAYVGAVVFSREEAAAASDREPRVRVYRGINQLDETVFNQAAYALRYREGEAKEMQVQDHLHWLVDALTEHPTYERLLAYVEAVWPELSDKQVRELERELVEIEDGVLFQGISVRTELVHKTYQRTGSYYADTGVAPYLSASTDAREAYGYGRRGVMVVDVPVSKLEALSARSAGEVAIKGSIPPEYISAILVKKSAASLSSSEHPSAVVPASVGPLLSTDVLSPDAVEKTYRGLRERERQEDAAAREDDVRRICERRSALVRKRFGDVAVDTAEVARIQSEEGANLYEATKRAVFDQLVGRYLAAGGSERRFQEMEYRRGTNLQTWATEIKGYDRLKATDDMLEALRRVVAYQERTAEVRRTIHRILPN